MKFKGFMLMLLVLLTGLFQGALADETDPGILQDPIVNQEVMNAENAGSMEQTVDPILQEQMKYLGLIIPEHVKKRFAELDKLPPPELIDGRDRFDWREMGGVTPVKSQGNCGSCWDFAATAAFESAILIKDGIEWDLSEQQVLSCNWGGSSCSGGWMDDAYDLFMIYGAVEESCMPYEADDTVPCYQDECEVVVTLQGVEDIANNVSAIKNALLDGPVSTTFMVYGDFHWNCYWHEDTGDLNHAVEIVGWDDDICDGGGWIVKNSWGEGWGDDGYFYMPYGSCGIGRYSQKPVYAGRPKLSFNYPNGLPDFLDSSGGTTARVEVEEQGGTPASGTGMLYYNDGSGWQSIAMEEIDPNIYDAIFPGFENRTKAQFYFSAETEDQEVVTDPLDAPESSYSAYSFENWFTFFEDNFETSTGWTVESDCSDGQWERGVPVGGDYRGDPPSDYDGSGQCYVTDNESGNSDIDDGYTYLMSPTIDLSEGDAVIFYSLWYTNNFGNDPENDLFKVWISSDDGATWVHAQTFGPETCYGWTRHSFLAGDFIALSDRMKVRFEGSDLNDGSVVEAGIDAVQVVRVEGEGTPDVSVAIEPNNPPVEVEPGGSFTYSGTLTNNLNEPTTTDVWVMVEVPGYGMYGPVQTLLDLPLNANQVVSRMNITQDVPNFAPPGIYNYIAYCGDYPSNPEDSSSFEFTVTSGGGYGSNRWRLRGWFD
jgi:hypothetical protein